jgi:predicted transport protein
MSDIKLFKIQNGNAEQLAGQSVSVEKSLQTLVEEHLETFLGVRFLATEYTTSKEHGGRMDTLGVDENGCPVIIEYKRSTNQNVVTQGLFYLDWLMDHRAAFKLLVMERLGNEVAETVEWGSPRLICIAGDFTKYDEHAVKQMNRNIELIRYRLYGGELLLLELVNAVSVSQPLPKSTETEPGDTTPGATNYKTISQVLKELTGPLEDLHEEVRAFLLSLGDDIQEKTLKYYVAYKRIKNFVCIDLRPQKNHLLLYLKIDAGSVEPEDGFVRDVSNVGHWGTGDTELTIRNSDDLKKAEPLILRSYENN